MYKWQTDDYAENPDTSQTLTFTGIQLRRECDGSVLICERTYILALQQAPIKYDRNQEVDAAGSRMRFDAQRSGLASAAWVSRHSAQTIHSRSQKSLQQQNKVVVADVLDFDALVMALLHEPSIFVAVSSFGRFCIAKQAR